MTADHSRPPDGLYQELLWVHSLLRRDLQTVQQLADEVRNGAAPEAVATTVASLQTSGPLWKLRANCLYYCRFVHGHHTLEDVALFPAIRRRDPALGSTVDRLERDHLLISEHIARINGRVRALGRSDTAEERSALLEDLEGLARHLLEHLGFEEESLAGVLQGMTMDDLRSDGS
jgi:hypothetical protein